MSRGRSRQWCEEVGWKDGIELDGTKLIDLGMRAVDYLGPQSNRTDVTGSSRMGAVVPMNGLRGQAT